MDASAGMVIGSRRGVGKVKHVRTVVFGAQEYVTSDRLKPKKVQTSQNRSDVLTKPVDGAEAFGSSVYVARFFSFWSFVNG